MFDSQHIAATEQNILNVHICYLDTIVQGHLGSNRQYIQVCGKLIMSYVCMPNATPLTLSIFRGHSLGTGNLCTIVIESRSNKGSHMVYCSSLMLCKVTCKIEHTWNSEIEGLTAISCVTPYMLEDLWG